MTEDWINPQRFLHKNTVENDVIYLIYDVVLPN